MKVLGWLVAALLCAAPALAQVNTERFRGKAADDGVSGSVELYFNNRTGNTDLLSGGAAVGLGWRADPHRLLLVGQVDVGTARAATTINRGFVHLRDTRAVTERTDWEVFVQHEYDQFARLSARTLMGTGPRFALYAGERLDCHLGAAYMAEREHIDVLPGAADDPATFTHRLATHLALAYRAGERTTLTNTVYVQPRWAETADTRVLDDLSLTVTLNGALSLKIAFTLRYDGEPPTGVKDLDTALSNRLVWDF